MKHSIEPSYRIHAKVYRFLYFEKNMGKTLSRKYGTESKQIQYHNAEAKSLRL